MRFVSRLNGFLFRQGTGLALVAMTALTTGDVLLRWITGRGVVGVIDATGLILLLFFFLTLPHSWSVDAHVRMDLIYDRLPRGARRAVDALGYAGAVVFVLIIGVRALRELPQMIASGVASQTISIPHWPVAAAIGALCLLSLAGIVAASLERGKAEEGQ